MAFVEQDIRLFSGTIFDNIAYGKSGATHPEVEAAAHVMNCMEFIERFPEGLLTRVGAGGVQLSGGQRQRVALARAIIRDPKILILDEATSSLDFRAENLVIDALKKATYGRTTLVITHKSATLAVADRVLVLSEGMVIEADATPEQMKKIPYLDTQKERPA